MPMWCHSADASGSTGAHHRIVRIPPGESVVLNSAEHAPYLLLLEVLNDDLNFDTNERRNKQLVKTIVQKAEHDSGQCGDAFTTLSATVSIEVQRSSPIVDSAIVDTLSNERGEQSPALQPTVPAEEESEDGEEVDLVEQLYGDLSVRQTPDISDSYVLPAPKNRALDIAAWSKRGSNPASPALTPSISSSATMPDYMSRSPEPQSFHPPVLSLDEYSERMRTAAIMLAQLNASTSQSQHKETSRPAHRASNSLTGDISNTHPPSTTSGSQPQQPRNRLPPTEVAAIRERIMQEMIALEEERMERMRVNSEADGIMSLQGGQRNLKTAEDEQIIRRELDKVDPSAAVFQESWATKKVAPTLKSR